MNYLRLVGALHSRHLFFICAVSERFLLKQMGNILLLININNYNSKPCLLSKGLSSLFAKRASHNPFDPT